MQTRRVHPRDDRDDAPALGLEEMVLPGGAYLPATITGQPPAVYAQTGPTFDELERTSAPIRTDH